MAAGFEVVTAVPVVTGVTAVVVATSSLGDSSTADISRPTAGPEEADSDAVVVHFAVIMNNNRKPLAAKRSDRLVNIDGVPAAVCV